ncbi:MAG: beta-propeller domain-containing protein [Planctomycetota bacterium]
MTRQNRRRASKRHCRLAIQSLEQRLNFSAVWDPYYGVPRVKDDAAVVTAGSQDNPIDLLANDGLRIRPFDQSEADSITLTQPGNGSVSIASDGTAYYTPNEGFEGIDHFTYTDSVSEITANVWVNVVHPIFAMRDWYRVDEGTENHVLSVLENDSLNAFSVGQDTSELRIVSVTDGDLGGSIEISADGRELIYTPGTSTRGEESFVYTIEDADGFASEATVRVQVTTLDEDTRRQVFPQQLVQSQLDAAMSRDGTRYGSSLMQPEYWHYTTDAQFDLRAMSNLTRTENATFSAASSTSFSTTNNQESSVEEGDLMKTDGEFLYLVSNWTDDDGTVRHELILTDVRDQTMPTIASRFALDGPVSELHLFGDRVAVLSESMGTVTATVLDVTDASTPKVISESSLDGIFGQSRLVGDQLYVVVATGAHLGPPALMTVCGAVTRGCFHETAQQYFDRVNSDLLPTVSPTVTTVDASGMLLSERTPVLETSQTASETRLSASTILSLNLSAASGDHVSDAYAFLHDPNAQLYVSPESIFFFAPSSPTNNRLGWVPPFNLATIDIDLGFWNGGTQKTSIEKISFDAEGQLEWAARGAIDGQVDNSFALSEHEGHLRVASSANGNSVYVLADQDGELNIVGSVEQLAPWEDIYSVRFEGDRGFVVTFRQVDPLFVLDLSDPESPRLLGELKITGYSNYLHVVDENHLLGIGREADQFGIFEEMQVTLFDISDPENPNLKHQYSFEGGRNVWSPLMDDAWNLGSHQAVSYFASHQTLVLPFYEGNHGWSWVRGGETAEVSMRVLDIDIEDGISAFGTVDFDEAFDPHLARSLRIGDSLVSLSPTNILIHPLRDPTESIGELLLKAEAGDDQLVTRGEESVAVDVLQNDRLPESEPIVIRVIPPATGGVARVNEDNSIEFEPAPGFVGETEFQYAVNRQGRELKATVRVDVKRAWHNRQEPMDVDQDGRIAAMDLLRVVNVLTEHGARTIDQLDSLADSSTPHVDVSGDGFVSAWDALLLVNHMDKPATSEIIDQAVEHWDEEPRDADSASLF